MSITKENTAIPSEDWVDIYVLTSINAGTSLSVQNIGATDLYYSSSDTKPARDHTAYRIFIRGDIIRLIDADEKVWIFSPQAEGLVNAEKNIPTSQQLQKSAYGEIINAELVPEIQISAEYNTFVDTNSFTIGTGLAVIEGGEFTLKATSAIDFAGIFSDDQIISRPGQGSVTRFSARFVGGMAGSRVTAGLVSTGDAIEFGYLDEEFGVFYDHSGLNGISELQITTSASGSEDATITLDGIPFTVPLTSGTVEHNAFEIVASLTAQTPFFVFSQNEDTVIIKGLFASAQVSLFSFVSSTAVGAFTQISVGAAVTTTFTAQADWNQDVKSDLDPSKTNYYTIRWNGDIEFFIQDSATGENILVHTLELPNKSEIPMFSINSFRIGWIASNTGNTIEISVRGTHGAAFNEGERILTSPTKGSLNSVSGVSTTLVNILTIRSRDVFGNKTNLGMIKPISINASATGNNKNAIIEVIRNATFSILEPNYSYHDKEVSIAQLNKISSVVSGGESAGFFVIGPDKERTIDGPTITNSIGQNDTLTVAMRVSSGGSTAEMDVSIVWQEDI